MKIAPLAVLRQTSLTTAQMVARPGLEIAEMLVRYHDQERKLKIEEEALKADLHGVRFPQRKSFVSWAALMIGEQARCPPGISDLQKIRLVSLVESSARLKDKANRIDKEVACVLEKLPAWIEELHASPFAEGLRESSEQLYADVFERRFESPLHKKDRQVLLSAMRLAQRAFYRTTPFPGFAHATVFGLKEEVNQPIQSKPEKGTAKDGLWIALSASYEPDNPHPVIFRETDRGVQAVKVKAPKSVSKAVSSLGITQRPRIINPQKPEAIAALRKLAEIGVVVMPRQLDSIQTEVKPQLAEKPDIDMARHAASRAVERLESVFSPLCQLGAFARVDSLRAWARENIGEGKMKLSQICREIEISPPDLSTKDSYPAFISQLREASDSGKLTHEITVPTPAATPEPKLSSVSLMTMYDAERDLVVLNRILPGGLRQVLRFLNHQEHSDAVAGWLAHFHGGMRLILRPHRDKPYQRVPGFGMKSLYLPREPFDPDERMVGLDEVDVACTKDGFRLILSQNGRLVAPFYAGCVREPNLHIGVQLICALSATPHIEPLDRLLEVHSFNDQKLLTVGDQLPLQRPRIIVGSVVLQRRRWAFPVAEVPLPSGTLISGRQLIALDAWRRKHGMPVRCSARKLTTGVPAYGQTPGILLDFLRPESVADVGRALKLSVADWFILEECLPDPMQPCAVGNVSEITVELSV